MSVLLRRVATPAVVAGLTVVVGAGIAAAYYSGLSGAGTGTATPLATTGTLTLTATGTVGTGLYPGGPGAGVTVTVANPYARPVVVTAVAAAGAVAVTPVPGRSCVVHAVAVAVPTAGLPATVPALSSGTSVTLAGVATMGTSAESGCQGATFTVPLRVTGRLS